MVQRRCLSYLLVLFAVASCKAQSLLFDYADSIILTTASVRLGLNSEQRNVFDNYISEKWLLLRCKHGDRIVRDARAVSKRMRSSMRERDWNDLFKLRQKWVNKLTDDLVKDSYDLVRVLRKSNWLKLQNSFDERNEKYVKALLEIREKRQNTKLREMIFRSIERSYGDLEPGVEERIKDQVPMDSRFVELILLDRTSTQKVLLSFLKEPGSRALYYEKVKEWLRRPELLRPSKFRDQYLQRRDWWRKFWSYAHNQVGEKSRAYWSDKLSSFATDFQRVIPSRTKCESIKSR